MSSSHFVYSDGSTVHANDVIVFGSSRGTVDRILAPRTEEARDFGCFETGGVLLHTECWGLVLLPYIGDDLVLLARGRGEG